MFRPQTQQSSSSSLTPYFPSSFPLSNPNPPSSSSSSYLPFPQPVFSLSPEPPLHPPGTDPYANSGLLPPTYVGFEGRTQTQTQYYADPNAVSHHWLIGGTLAEPNGYAIQSLPENQLTSTSSNSLWNGHWATQSLGHGPMRIKQEQTKCTQPLRCEVCKVDCNSKGVFDKHVLGKKHKKNLEMQNSSLTVATSSESNINMLHDIRGQVLPGTSHVAASEDVVTKKRKLLECGTTESVRVCTVCNVACNSQEVFNTHLKGKKHAIQAGLIPKKPHVVAIRSRHDSNSKKRPKKNKTAQSAWCEVCQINCNSTEIYAMHLAGKKHLKNIEKLEKAKSAASASNALPSATDSNIGPMENPDANMTKTNDDIQKTQKSSAQGPENLVKKKRKIIGSGTGAGAVRTCTICNVVCNSQMVFDSHLAGQKHATMVKKQAASGMSMLGPPLPT